MPSLLLSALILLPAPQAKAAAWPANLTKERTAVLGRIAEDSLKGNLSFIASDALEGRGTPSRGLNIAAEFIAAKFRAAGLEPLGDDGYFQTNTMTVQGGEPQKVRNVVGLLRGSDPVLKETYILVTAHYDHLGIARQGEGDVIFNGANDDGSGTVAVVELANALRGYKPKRSIVFMTFYGEERGLLGSNFYGKNPLVPIEKTIADVNIECIGQTDEPGKFWLTGADYSDVGKVFAAAGKALNVSVDRHPQYSDPFFLRSDNRALAVLGVPAHTLCTGFEFPDYHKVTDHWEKIDFPTMLSATKVTGLAIMMLADSASEPRWDEKNPKAAAYLKAWQERRSGG